jgi:hypothetical protein
MDPPVLFPRVLGGIRNGCCDFVHSRTGTFCDHVDQFVPREPEATIVSGRRSTDLNS